MCESLTCSICMEIIDDSIPSMYRGILSCNHEFHPKCILNWFSKQTNCPLCRNEHTTQDSITNIISIQRNTVRAPARLPEDVQEVTRMLFNPENIPNSRRIVEISQRTRNSLQELISNLNIPRAQEEGELDREDEDVPVLEENEENENYLVEENENNVLLREVGVMGPILTNRYLID